MASKRVLFKIKYTRGATPWAVPGQDIVGVFRETRLPHDSKCPGRTVVPREGSDTDARSSRDAVVEQSSTGFEAK